MMFASQEVGKLIYNTMTGLKILHDKNITHNSIKPSNIFIGKNGEYKLGVFGKSCFVCLVLFIYLISLIIYLFNLQLP
jgi:serine/threonine protein kinase